MKNSHAEFCVVSYRPDMQRRELVDVGILLNTPEGARLSISPNLSKLTALDPNVNLASVHSAGTRLLELANFYLRRGTPLSELHRIMGEAPAGLLVGGAGQVSTGALEADDVIADLMGRLIQPPSPMRERKAQVSGLHAELRALFKQSKMLGTKPSDIANHLVVPRFPIDADTGLFAEFAIRNGKLHVTETVDFRTGNAADRKREAQAKTLVLLQALSTVGASDLRRYVVVTSIKESWAGPSLNLLGKHAEDLIVRESAEDWQRYTEAMSAAAKHEATQTIQ